MYNKKKWNEITKRHSNLTPVSPKSQISWGSLLPWNYCTMTSPRIRIRIRQFPLSLTIWPNIPCNGCLCVHNFRAKKKNKLKIQFKINFLLWKIKIWKIGKSSCRVLSNSTHMWKSISMNRTWTSKTRKNHTELEMLLIFKISSLCLSFTAIA